MPGKRYSPEVKEAILAAIKKAKKAKESFADVFKAAKAAGYKGGESGLKALMYGKGRRKIKKAGIVRRGRPKGTKNKVAAPIRVGGLSQIEVIVQREVEKRLRIAKEAAIKALSESIGV